MYSTFRVCRPSTLRRTATRCDTLQHTATHCNTLQHTATHCNTLQHTIMRRSISAWSWCIQRFERDLCSYKQKPVSVKRDLCILYRDLHVRMVAMHPTTFRKRPMCRRCLCLSKGTFAKDVQMRCTKRPAHSAKRDLRPSKDACVYENTPSHMLCKWDEQRDLRTVQK